MQQPPFNEWETASRDGWSARSVEAALAAGANPNEVFKHTPAAGPLHCAAAWYSADGVVALLKGDANVNGTTQTGNTPLHIAASPDIRAEAVVKALLAGGADPNQRNGRGETALIAAVPAPYHTVAPSIPIFAALLAAGADAGVLLENYACESGVARVSLRTPLTRVLLIEDDPDAATLASMLIQAGAAVPEAGTAIAEDWHALAAASTTWKVVEQAMAWPASRRCTWIEACLQLGFAAAHTDADADADVQSAKRVRM